MIRCEPVGQRRTKKWRGVERRGREINGEAGIGWMGGGEAEETFLVGDPNVRERTMFLVLGMRGNKRTNRRADKTHAGACAPTEELGWSADT